MNDDGIIINTIYTSWFIACLYHDAATQRIYTSNFSENTISIYTYDHTLIHIVCNDNNAFIKLNRPRFITMHNNHLYICNTNNRVVVYDVNKNIVIYEFG